MFTDESSKVKHKTSFLQFNQKENRDSLSYDYSVEGFRQ